MSFDIEHLFGKINKTEVKTEPFEHLVIDNILPNDFYVELARELEEENFVKNYMRAPYGNKERFGVDITDWAQWKATGQKKTSLIHQHNYNSLFSGTSTNIKLFVKSLIENQEKFYSLLCSKLSTERIRDKYFFHINMTKDSIGYKIEPHTDDKENIYTILFYTPKTDINKKIAALKICEQKVYFVPNRMVIFAPSRPDNNRPPTWHQVEQLSRDLVGTRNSFQMFFMQSK